MWRSSIWRSCSSRRDGLASAGVRRLLLGAAVTFATLATANPAALTILWAVSIVATTTTIRSTVGGRTTARVYGRMMAVAIVCMAIGTALLVADPMDRRQRHDRARREAGWSPWR